MTNHVIGLIKRENKYLLYYDKRWECLLFINYKMLDSFKDLDLKKYIDELFNTNCEVKYIKDIIHTKYSVSHKCNREYHHYFYSIECDISNKDFILDGIEYKWITINEMKNNNRIMQVNSDIVNFVENI